jgi:glycine reductase
MDVSQAHPPVRVVHYVNQFFGGLGGEAAADTPLVVREGPVGPGRALAQAWGAAAAVVATCVAGDNWFVERGDDALAAVLAVIGEHRPDVVVAGPAFAAGRYGQACGAICAAVEERLGRPAVTAMAPDNPAAEPFRRRTAILVTGESVADMPAVLPRLASLALRRARGEPLGPAAVEGTLPRGLRRNVFRDRPGSRRAIDMLLAKLAGEPFRTELAMSRFEAVAPAAPLAELARATIGLVTEAGLVPKGNPDRLPAMRATRWVRYPLAGRDDLVADSHEAIHGGFDNRWVNEDPDRVLPVDALRSLEREHVIGRLLDAYYVTTGNNTAVEAARRFGTEIAAELGRDRVHGVVLPAT